MRRRENLEGGYSDSVDKRRREEGGGRTNEVDGGRVEGGEN